jgi:lipoate-protein ligase B
LRAREKKKKQKGIIMRPVVKVARLRGLTSYADGQTLQQLMLSRLRASASGGVASSGSEPLLTDTLLLLEHRPVFTLGRLQSSAENVLASAAEIEAAGAAVVQSDRGGNVTFHGPGQLVAYPILDLRRHKQDLRWYVSRLEEAMIGACAAFGVPAHPGGDGQTGVWVKPGAAATAMGDTDAAGDDAEQRKIGALGVRVNRWYSSHGIALNADVDLGFFDMIVPCGLSETPKVTSLSNEVGRRIGVDELAPAFCDAFAQAMDVELEEGDVSGLLREAHAAKVMAGLAPVSAGT